MSSEHHKTNPPFAVFLSTAVLLFVLTFSAADSIGFVPYYIDGTAPRSQTLALSDLPELGEEKIQPVEVATPDQSISPVAVPVVVSEKIVLPTHLSISKINLDVQILNTQSRDAGVLDEALKKAPVRYMDSAKLGEDGNILIFAHSSHLPVVHNQMFKVFNRLSELKVGDTITVSGDGESHVYSVVLIRKADASEEVIDLSKNNGRRLTLSTCDNFGAKTSRWVVEAVYVGKSE